MKKEMQKWLCGAGAVAVCVMLAGCGHEHTWAEATCTEPKTCIECGETEGEALGHTWVEATCTEAKHCSVCGETEGEPLEHTWIEANYQDPKTCSVCGATEGEPLPADFETYGLTINAEEGGTYDYVTVCSENSSKTTVGHATFSDYRIIEEDAELGLEKKDGYEWRALHVSIAFDDENANNYGMSIGRCYENYYDIEGWDNSSEYDEETNMNHYVVNYHGTDYESTLFYTAKWLGWVNETNTYEYDVYVNVPIGYDGVVIGFHDSKTSWGDGMHIYDIADDNTLFFRMD